MPCARSGPAQHRRHSRADTAVSARPGGPRAEAVRGMGTELRLQCWLSGRRASRAWRSAAGSPPIRATMRRTAGIYLRTDVSQRTTSCLPACRTHAPASVPSVGRHLLLAAGGTRSGSVPPHERQPPRRRRVLWHEPRTVQHAFGGRALVSDRSDGPPRPGVIVLAGTYICTHLGI